MHRSYNNKSLTIFQLFDNVRILMSLTTAVYKIKAKFKQDLNEN